MNFADQMSRMQSHVENVEHHMGLGIEKVNREIDRLKFDLTDMIE